LGVAHLFRALWLGRGFTKRVACAAGCSSRVGSIPDPGGRAWGGSGRSRRVIPLENGPWLEEGEGFRRGFIHLRKRGPHGRCGWRQGRKHSTASSRWEPVDRLYRFDAGVFTLEM